MTTDEKVTALISAVENLPKAVEHLAGDGGDEDPPEWRRRSRAFNAVCSAQSLIEQIKSDTTATVGG